MRNILYLQASKNGTLMHFFIAIYGLHSDDWQEAGIYGSITLLILASLRCRINISDA
jgi:hypothetical protein